MTKAKMQPQQQPKGPEAANENEPGTDLVQQSQPENGETSVIRAVDLERDMLPDLSKARELPIDYVSEYWTPEKAGESKRVFFDRIGNAKVKAFDNDDIIQIECAFFIEKDGDVIRRISNGSRRLVSAIMNHSIKRGTPIMITYLGKKKNRTNGFNSDIWSIKPLLIQLASTN